MEGKWVKSVKNVTEWRNISMTKENVLFVSFKHFVTSKYYVALLKLKVTNRCRLGPRGESSVPFGTLGCNMVTFETFGV